MSYSPDTGNDNYTLTPVNAAGTRRNEGEPVRCNKSRAERGVPNLYRFPTPNLGFMV